jgi:hypothetical protein
MDPTVDDPPYDRSEAIDTVEVCHERIYLLFNEKKSWRTDRILMNVIDDINANPHTTDEVNIAQFIGTMTGSRGDKGKSIYLADFNENTEEYQASMLFPAFKDACKAEGFEAI